MPFIADLHIHSHFSRATSKELVPEVLDYWARLKGITVVGTGDFTHPGWTKELKEKLVPAEEEGLFKLAPAYRSKERETPFLPPAEVRFMLTAEISNIYKKNGKVRKVHNIVFAPGFEVVEKIQQKLTAIGANITSDGRPILGMDSRDLLEMMLDCSEDIFFAPAHVWTPWFSVLGSKSGFDTVAECYGDLSPHISAVETGLSTDPPMHWMCSFLDQYTLISNSDAHSPERLGRNAICFRCEPTYPAMMEALRSGDPRIFGGTIDLFPQEGKYHYDGHRKCGICWNPVETLSNQGRCTVCGKPVTVGVMNRVVRLSDRENLEERPNRAPFHSIIPLKEILSEIEGVGPGSKRVGGEYMRIIKGGHPELPFLLDLPLQEIKRLGGPQLAEALGRMRRREVYVKEGYDGEYGVITVFHKKESANHHAQDLLFKDLAHPRHHHAERRKMINFDLIRYHRLIQLQEHEPEPGIPGAKANQQNEFPLNPRQQAAVEHFTGPALVIAGPGTGKTRVLTQRIVFLVRRREVSPRNILAVTFTNKAAAEISERLERELGEETPPVKTFHGFGYSLLEQLCAPGERMAGVTGRTAPFSIIDGDDKKRILKNLGCDPRRINKPAEALGEAKRLIKSPQQFPQENETEEAEFGRMFRRYEEQLKTLNAFDLEDLIYLPVRLLEEYPGICRSVREQFQWLLVDEYQDVNYAQYRLILALAPAGGAANLCVIGDPDQAIYGFRGADVRFIRQFETDYPHARRYRLTRSYRCSDSILQASGGVIAHNSETGAKHAGELKGIEKGVRIKISRNETGKMEAEFVARTIEDMMGGLRFFSMDSSITAGEKETGIESLSDFAVLCRVKAQLGDLEEAFRNHTIPCQVVGETPFFKIPPLKTAVEILRLSQNPACQLLRDRVLEAPDLSPLQLKPLLAALQRENSAKKALLLVRDVLPGVGEKEEADFKRLLQLASMYETKGDFLKFASLGGPVDLYQPGLERVTLMTLHAAKGLEFKCVFIVGCEEGLLPYTLYAGKESDPQEERRLLYVGMTRARKYLYLSHAAKRRLGNREFSLERSTFLDGIERELLEVSRQKPLKKADTGPGQRSLFGTKPGDGD